MKSYTKSPEAVAALTPEEQARVEALVKRDGA